MGGHSLFTCEPQSQPTLGEYLTGIELPQRRETVRRGRDRSVYCCRWLNDVPLRDGADAMPVNWLKVEITNANGKVTYCSSFATDRPVDENNVAELAACGRARWKIENEGFKVLRNNGYNLERNFGHGKKTLSAAACSSLTTPRNPTTSASTPGPHSPHALPTRMPK
ncbi:MAG: hypothetical protein ACHQRJ_03480 [Alphaproteobacteria bacterium]